MPQPPKWCHQHMSLWGVLLIQTIAIIIMSTIPIIELSSIISTLKMRRFRLRNFVWFPQLHGYWMEVWSQWLGLIYQILQYFLSTRIFFLNFHVSKKFHLLLKQDLKKWVSQKSFSSLGSQLHHCRSMWFLCKPSGYLNPPTFKPGSLTHTAL